MDGMAECCKGTRGAIAQGLLIDRTDGIAGLFKGTRGAVARGLLIVKMDEIFGMFKGIRGAVARGLLISMMVVLAGGCPQLMEPAKVVVVLGGAEYSGESGKNGAVGLDEIASLNVTVTKITMDYAGREDVMVSDGTSVEGAGTSEDGAASSEEGDAAGILGRITVFEGEKRLDIRDLSGIADTLTAVNVDPGYYTKIRLYVSDPELRLVSAPETPINDIHLTANARLFVSETFLLPEGQTSVIQLDFEGLHIVETGQGSYTWTPQLRAAVEVQAVEGE